MIDIQLNNNNAYEWIKENNNYCIGYGYYNGKLLNEKAILDNLKNINEEKDLIKFVKELNGAFSIVKIFCNRKIYMATDLARTFPILYTIEKEDIFVSDDITKFSNPILNEDNVQELLALRVCSNSKTIYDNIYQVPSATIAIINDKKSFEEIEYFRYETTKLNTSVTDKIYKEMYDLYDKAVKRMIQYVNKRTIVIPLSGGYDSRLIAYHLKQNNYNNVICYTYGRKDNPEYISANKVAQFLNYPLYFIEYKSKDMKRKYYNKKEYTNMVNYFGRGNTTPIIQEWIAIDYLLNNKIINKNCIVAPGFLGDFIAGGEMKYDKLLTEEYATSNKLKEYILEKSYCYRKFNNRLRMYFTKEISKTLAIDLNDLKLDKNTILTLLEKFDYKERETKYINNAIRTYDYYGLKWYIIYMDKDLMNYFKNIDRNMKINREQYKDYVKKYYNELLNYAPIASKKERSSKVYRGFVARNINRIKIVLTTRKDNIINFYGFFTIKDYLRHCVNKRTNIISMISTDYIDYIKNKSISK